MSPTEIVLLVGVVWLWFTKGDARTSRVDEAMARAKSALAEAEETKLEIRHALEDVNDALDELRSEITDNIQPALRSAAQAVEDLTAVITAQEDDLAELRLKVAALRGVCDTLESSHGDLDGRVDSLESRFETSSDE